MEKSQIVARVRVEQRRRWLAGDLVPVEKLIKQLPPLSAKETLDLQMDLIFREVMLREDRGEAPALDELVRRFPDLENSLREQFLVHQAMRRPSTNANDQEATRPATLHGSSETDTPPPPANVPGYEILGELGHGGMGIVYKARHVQLQRIVALKMMLGGLHANPDLFARFRNEAEAIARLQHPNLVQVFEVGEHEGRPFFAMEFVDGVALDQKISGLPQPPKEAAELVETFARAVQAVHAHGILHRDLKPANVLIGKDGVAKVTDFGLAKRVDSAAHFTMTGDILGTPLYMAPEQASGKSRAVGPQSDIYSLGAILYEMLTGKPPFEAETTYELMQKVIKADPLPPSRTHNRISRDLETICLKCLEKDPAKRYTSAGALADDLRRYLNGEPIHARPIGPLQRGVKWARRHPTAAALLGVSACAILVLFVGGIFYNMRLQNALNDSKAQAEISRQRLVRLHVTNGTDHLDQGDWFGALVWFAEALKLDEGHPDREAMHRLRLGMVSHQCPKLQQMWFHDGAVRTACFSPDGSMVATASADGMVRLFHAVSGAVIAKLPHPGGALLAEFSADGHKLLTASEKFARVWDPDSGRPLSEPFEPLDPGDKILWAAINPVGTHVAIGCFRTGVSVWDLSRPGTLPLRLPSQAPIRWVAFSPDNRKLATASADGTARVWAVDTGKPLTSYLRHEAAINHVVFSPDGTLLLTSSEDASARLWNIEKGIETVPPLIHKRNVVSATFKADGKLAATVSDDRTVCVWVVDTGELEFPPLKHGSEVNAAAFSPGLLGDLIVSGSDDDAARLWDGKTGELLPPRLPHNGQVTAVAFSPDGRRVVTASNDLLVRVWDVSAERLACCAKEDEVVPHKVTPRLINEARIMGRVESPDGRLVAQTEAGRGYYVQVYEQGTGKPVGTPLAHGSTVVFGVFSPDSERLATASDDNLVRLWDARTGKLLTPPLKYNGTPIVAAFSPDGKLLAAAAMDETARVWDSLTGDPLTPPLLHRTLVDDIEFAPDGKTVYTICEKRFKRTWRLYTENSPLADLLPSLEARAMSHIDLERGFLPLDIDSLRKLWKSPK